MPNRTLSATPQGDGGDGGGEDWLATYGDMVTLLMAFFVLLFSMSTLDPRKFEEATAAITEEITGEKPKMPLADVMKTLNDSIKRNELENDVWVSSDGSGIVIEFASSLLFESGQSILHSRGVEVLDEVGGILANPNFTHYGIEVEGHTDDVPIQTIQFPSNWELSGARASTVIKLFIGKDIHIQRMKATGYAYTLPKVPNRTDAGEPIPENQASNRRIVVRMFPQTYREMSASLRKEVERLNQTNKSDE